MRWLAAQSPADLDAAIAALAEGTSLLRAGDDRRRVAEQRVHPSATAAGAADGASRPPGEKIYDLERTRGFVWHASVTGKSGSGSR